MARMLASSVLVMLFATSGLAQPQRPELVASIQIATPQNPRDIRQISISRDGRKLVTGISVGRSRLWDVASGAPLREEGFHSGSVVAVGFSPDGSMAFTADWKNVQLWDAATGARGSVMVCAQEDYTVLAPVFSPQGDVIATRNSIESVRLWDAKTGRPVTDALPHDSPVYGIEFSPDGRWLLTTDKRTARVWDSKTGKLVCGPLQNDSAVSGGASFSADSRRLATCSSENNAVRIWDVESERAVGRPLVHPVEVASNDRPLHQNAPRLVRFGPDDVLLTSNADHVFLWYGATGDAPRKQKLQNSARMDQASFLPDGKRAVTLSHRKVAAWQVGKSEPLWQHQHTDANHSTRFTVSDDGRFVLVHTRSASWRLCDVMTGEVVAAGRHSHTAALVGPWLAVGGKNSAKVWALPAGA